ncbi:DUF427 domain-containing protein [Amycolatopsis azurea]|uniref:DUF427 domain-containing protein n=1 Tax=Amycolatopsis azurea TaxID=36819 RepID=UPI00381302D9
MLKPSANHPITVAPNEARVVVTVGGKVVADSANALTLREANYPPAQYIPRADVDFGVLERTEHSTYCPFKGDASYYSIRTGDGVAENAVWTYEAPHDAVAEIKDHVAFYPSKVDAIEER